MEKCIYSENIPKCEDCSKPKMLWVTATTFQASKRNSEYKHEYCSKNNYCLENAYICVCREY